MRRVRHLVLMFLLAGAVPVEPVLAWQPAAAQDEFVPMSEIPPDEQLPAAPMLIGAYAFVWVALVAYVVGLVKRLTKVEADLAALERSLGRERR